jgi:hypothetical protein
MQAGWRPEWRGWAILGLLVVGAIVIGWAVRYVTAGRAAPGGTWGPLAVVADDYGAAALLPGTLRISDECVTLTDNGGDAVLLVWPADRTAWFAEHKEIGFRNRDGTAMTLRDGDAVAFGGGGDSSSEGGLGGQAWVSSMDWVAEPDPDCPLDVRFTINEVAASP